MDTPESPGLLQRIASGDASAVQETMEAYGNLVWSLARRFSESAADAEDATQEIFLEIWKSAARFDPERGKETTFIATIARRRLIDRVRAAGRRPPTEEYDESLATHHALQTADASPIEADAAAAQRALQQLKPDQREILLLGIVEGLTHSEIATRTGKPLGTIKTHMRRGLIRLRELIEGDNPDEAAG